MLLQRAVTMVLGGDDACVLLWHPVSYAAAAGPLLESQADGQAATAFPAPDTPPMLGPAALGQLAMVQPLTNGTPRCC